MQTMRCSEHDRYMKAMQDELTAVRGEMKRNSEKTEARDTRTDGLACPVSFRQVLALKAQVSELQEQVRRSVRVLALKPL